MGTRSRIGIQLQDNSVLSVYCHYDGYPEFNGRVLRDNYDTIEKVRNLIDGGDMSAPGQMQVGTMKLCPNLVLFIILPVVNLWRAMHHDMMKASLIFLTRRTMKSMLTSGQSITNGSAQR